MVSLDHTFSTEKSLDESWKAILDLERLIPAVQGGKVLDASDPEKVRAEIHVRMGAMSMKFRGTVAVLEHDDSDHRAVMQVKSREASGSSNANATVTFTLNDGGGAVHTEAQITGKAASMGEGVIVSVLDALIKDFMARLATI